MSVCARSRCRWCDECGCGRGRESEARLICAKLSDEMEERLRAVKGNEIIV